MCSSNTRLSRPAKWSASCSATSPASSRPTPRASTTSCIDFPMNEISSTMARPTSRFATRSGAGATQDPVAREGLARIMRMFQLERRWKDRSPDERKALRDRHLRLHVVAFFVFAEEAYERVKHQRGLLRTALGYCVRQKNALMRFLEDGRLEMTNNHSERQLRKVACGRKAWLFVGSDDHGQAAGNLLTLIASARLHKLDPELYLRDVFRVLPHWPRERYLELAPRYWSATRARLDPKELDQELGPLTVPEPALPTAAASPVPLSYTPRAVGPDPAP